MSIYVDKIAGIKTALSSYGYRIIGDEPMKITVAPAPLGYTGTEIADALRLGGVEAEFSDPDYVVLMPSPRGGDEALERACKILLSISARAPRIECAPRLSIPEQVISPREAMLRPQQTVPASESLGRVLGTVTIGCPPAVPIIVSGERIDEACLAAFEYYGVDTVSVIK